MWNFKLTLFELWVPNLHLNKIRTNEPVNTTHSLSLVYFWKLNCASCWGVINGNWHNMNVQFLCLVIPVHDVSIWDLTWFFLIRKDSLVWAHTAWKKNPITTFILQLLFMHVHGFFTVNCYTYIWTFKMNPSSFKFQACFKCHQFCIIVDLNVSDQKKLNMKKLICTFFS